MIRKQIYLTTLRIAAVCALLFGIEVLLLRLGFYLQDDLDGQVSNMNISQIKKIPQQMNENDTNTTELESHMTRDVNKSLQPQADTNETESFRYEPTMEERLSLLGAQVGDPVYIRIFKLTAELEIWIKIEERYELLQTYEICRQSGYLGPKIYEGDRQGPEGFYSVTKERLNPNSKFHLAFNIGYPNTFDRAQGRTGSALMVHGGCVSVGCFAMTDEKIEEIYELVERALERGEKSISVHIFPFRMNSQMMQKYQDHRWSDFWSNLKEGYDYFETHQKPPCVGVGQMRYTFQ